jgi:hypothetical protein
MAVSGTGTKPMGSTVDPAMVDQQHYDARSGAPKKTQTSFPVKGGMKDMNAQSGTTGGIGGGKFDGAPDASSPNPLDPEPRVKVIKPVLNTPWGMKGASPDMSPSQQNGKDVHGMPQGTSLADSPTAGKVLGNAILSGSTKLPGTVSGASGPAPAYTGKDPN